MKHYIKNLYDKSVSPPLFIGQREEVVCPHCQQRVVIAVLTTCVDWQRVALDYKQYAETLYKYANEILRDAGCDTILTHTLAKLRKQLNDEMGNNPTD